MDELRSYSVLNFVRSQKKTDLCRFVFCALIKISSDQLLKFVARCAKEKFANSLTGILLVYPNYIVHLLESPEYGIFQICSYFVNAEPKFLGISKCFPMQIEIDERFFDKWHARKVADICDAVVIEGKEFMDNFDNIKKMYCQMIDSLYGFCNDLRASRLINRTGFINELDALATKRDLRLPEVKTLRSILETSWGESLEKMVEDYCRGISSTDVEEVVWPFPTDHCPPIDTIK